MLHLMYCSRNTVSTLVVAICILLGLLAPATAVHAAPPAQPSQTVSVELSASQDARIQGGSPDQGFGGGFIWVGTPNGHLALVQFDLTVLPVDATISSAELHLNFTGVYTGTANVEVGRNDGAWDEATITWNTQPAITFGGPIQPVGDAPSEIMWNVTSLVAQWQSGAVSNNGFALRGDGRLKSFYSKETNASLAPKLVVVYAVPVDAGQPRPDLGDAPDSTNHHGLNNTAYSGTGVMGQFPTVWDVPAGQPAGPRHDNQTGEGILGQYLSREAEADLGPDQDDPNNILRNATTGAVGDMADNDRGDDGWRNRNIKFVDCRKQTLTVRVTKAPGATLNRMYLNVWFDGNRDGDWADIVPCQSPDGGPAQAAYEWIVQDHIVDMTAIPAGGYLDFQIDTARVLNHTEGKRHWMRFMLSEARAVSGPASAYPDGRGPHPGSYQFGETEDVLQAPPPPGEAGTLVLEKRVLDAANPVDYPGVVTYQIRLRHDGGSQPVQAEIRDELPYPLHLLPQLTNTGNIAYVDVTSASGGAAPLEAELTYVTGDVVSSWNQLVTWQGTLEPNSEVVLSFDVHVHPLCGPNQQTEAIRNVAEARPKDGSPLTAEATFIAKCPGYDANNIEINLEPNPLDPGDLADLAHVSWQGQIRNNHALPVTLGFFQEPAGVTASAVSQPPILARVTFQPNEQKLVDLVLRMESEFSDELTLAEDYSPIGALKFCILPGEDDSCPDAAKAPQLIGEAPQPPFTPRPSDLGDAPDSTNHAGVAMAAYAGVQARYPTVFDPATGLPQGPRHRFPGALHLGPLVSREAEADIGPDQDGVNNIAPPANTPNLDWFDDGARLSGLANCQPATADARVFISPQAAAWFQQQAKPAYLNIWLDFNHDGDWEDGFTCQDAQGQQHNVVEHILIDLPLDVAALGAGLHNLNNIITDRVLWPAQLAQEPRWVRFTLSEAGSNKTLQFGAIAYGDGRGYGTAFRTGETEDTLLQPAGGPGDGPDMAVRLTGKVERQTTQTAPPAVQAASLVVDYQVRFKIEYTNRGSQPARNAVLTFRKPEQLGDQAVILLHGPGVQPSGLSQNGAEARIALADLPPGASGSIVLGFGSPADLHAAGIAASASYVASVRADLDGDVDPGNNSATATLERPNERLLIGAVVDDDTLWRKADSTCRNIVNLVGSGEAGKTINLRVNGGNLVTVMMDANGGFEAQLTNLPEGRNFIRAEYADGLSAAATNVLSPRDTNSGSAVGLKVDSSLPIDPISLTFTDSQGRVVHPPTLNWSWGASQTGSYLRGGETYAVSVDGCSGDPNLQIKLVLDGILVTHLVDIDGDGRYSGSFTYNPGMQAASASADTELRLVVSSSGLEQSFMTAMRPLSQGTVRDGMTGQPLAGASVAALTSDGEADALSSDPNPQITDADGGYGFTAAAGIYRLDVARSGYQPYRSSDIDAGDGVLATEIMLTPATAEQPDHVVYVTDHGFEPAVVTARPGDIVQWVNADLAEHSTVRAGAWDSGVLGAGASYMVKLGVVGEYTYDDGANPANVGLVSVSDTSTTSIGQIFLPLVTR